MEEIENLDFPPMKLREDDDKIYLDIDVPGFKEEDITINLEEDSINVTLERSSEKTSKGKDSFSGQWRSSSFSGSMTLPAKIIPELVHHTYDGKILKIELEKE